MCEDSRLCYKHMVFVEDDETCESFENEELYNPIKIVLLTIVVIAITIFLIKIL